MELSNHYDSFESAGVEILAVSSDSPECAIELRERLDLRFPIVSDPDCETIRRYGIYHDNEPKNRDIARPAVYLIDEDGVIKYRYVGADKDDRPLVQALLQFDWASHPTSGSIG